MRLINSERGYTLMELLIATALTGIMTMAGLQYYVHIQNQTLSQEDIGDMQQTARNSLEEISKTLRMAGYKVPSTHSAYETSADTLRVFFSGTQPIDTVTYYLDRGTDLNEENPRYLLMKQVNSDAPAVFSDYIQALVYRVVSASVVDVTITVGVDRSDEEYSGNGGIRRFTLAERVQMRNLNL